MTVRPRMIALVRLLRGTPDADRAAARRAYTGAAWASLVAVFLLVFGLPAAIDRGADETPFDRSAVDALANTAPDYVFIGDSMLETRIVRRRCWRDVVRWSEPYHIAAAWMA